jgi:F-type H+-transporting ATPase subunit a
MPSIELAPSVIFSIGHFNVTTTYLLQIFVSLLVIVVFVVVAKRWKQIPSKFQLVIELALRAVYDQINGVTHNEAKTKIIFPLIFTLFVFIFISNVFALTPGLSAVSIHNQVGKSIHFSSGLADYGMVLMMAAGVVFLSQVLFIIYHGMKKFWQKWFNLKGPLEFFLGLMEIVSEMAKIISLSFRLFGNVFADEVLLLVVSSLVPLVVPIPFMALGIFFAFIQAYVFSLLSTIYLSTAMSEHGH